MLVRLFSHPVLLSLSVIYLFSFVRSNSPRDYLVQKFSSSTSPPAYQASFANPTPATWQLRPSARAGRRLHGDAQTDNDPSVPPEANIAFFLQISDSTLGHLPRLLERIHHPQNHYALHFDRKMDAGAVKRAVDSMFEKRPQLRDNVFIMPSELITYRGVSMLLNTINAMGALLDRNKKWHYFINLSGSDYPVVSQTTMRRLLGVHTRAPLNFLSFAPPESWAERARFRFSHLYVDEALGFGTNSDSRVLHLGTRNPLADSANFTLAQSEAWMIGSRELCDFVVKSGYARKLLVAVGFSVEASEHYFATLTWNHARFNRTIVPHAMRHVVWHFGEKKAGQHPFYVDARDEKGDMPLATIVDRTPNLFIRKFRYANSELMDRLDGKWGNMTHLQRVRDHFSWAVRNGMHDHAGKPALRAEDYVDI